MGHAVIAARIRRFRDRDADAVRALFIRINRELAQAALRGAFQSYNTVALREEIDRIPAYFGCGPAQGLWVAADAGDNVIGFSDWRKQVWRRPK
jgi:hypothetical protein